METYFLKNGFEQGIKDWYIQMLIRNKVMTITEFKINMFIDLAISFRQLQDQAMILPC